MEHIKDKLNEILLELKLISSLLVESNKQKEILFIKNKILPSNN